VADQRVAGPLFSTGEFLSIESQFNYKTDHAICLKIRNFVPKNPCELQSLIQSRKQVYVPAFLGEIGAVNSKGPYLILHEDTQQHVTANCLSPCIPEVIQL